MSSLCEPSADTNAAPYHAAFSFDELVRAYFDCRKTKRNSHSALAFEQNLERNLIQLRNELLSGSYRIGPSICFVITHPKPREVWASEFRDRIVHHLLYNRIAPIFEPTFIADSCACIPGRGTLRARHYVRYVDDFIILHPSAAWLNDARQRIEALLAERLAAELNPTKTVLQPVARGVDFVGQVIKPWRRTTRRKTVAHACRRITQTADNRLRPTTNSYFGLLRQASHSRHDRAQLAKAAMGRGRAVDLKLTKIYR